jgi:hypothetical protein
MAFLLQGFLLGLASGVSCLATCAPVLLPYLVGEGGPMRRNAHAVLSFLGGRLTGYLIFALFAWEAGRWLRSSSQSGLIFGGVYAVLACVLVIYGFSSPAGSCAAGSMRGRMAAIAARRPALLPACMGFLTGLSLCPPFLAALAGATSQTTVFASLLFFFSFFVATSLYVIPFPLAGLLGRFPAVRITGRLAAGVMGIYFLYRGLIMIYGGLHS